MKLTRARAARRIPASTGATIGADPGGYLHALILDTEFEAEPGERTGGQLADAVFAKIRPADYGALLRAALEDHAPRVVDDFLGYLDDAGASGKCEREEWCEETATRTYVRTDHHYDPGDERADVPFETVRTCDRHPMGDGHDGRLDHGWRRA